MSFMPSATGVKGGRQEDPTFYLSLFTFHGAARLCPCNPLNSAFIPAPPDPSQKLMKGERSKEQGGKVKMAPFTPGNTCKKGPLLKYVKRTHH